MKQTFCSKLPSAQKITLNGVTDNKWVMYEGKVGIVTNLTKWSATFNAVGDDGLTYVSLPVNPYNLRLATYAEIPDIRKPTPERAYELGYALVTH